MICDSCDPTELAVIVLSPLVNVPWRSWLPACAVQPLNTNGRGSLQIPTHRYIYERYGHACRWPGAFAGGMTDAVTGIHQVPTGMRPLSQYADKAPPSQSARNHPHSGQGRHSHPGAHDLPGAMATTQAVDSTQPIHPCQGKIQGGQGTFLLPGGVRATGKTPQHATSNGRVKVGWVRSGGKSGPVSFARSRVSNMLVTRAGKPVSGSMACSQSAWLSCLENMYCNATVPAFRSGASRRLVPSVKVKLVKSHPASHNTRPEVPGRSAAFADTGRDTGDPHNQAE